MKLGSDSTVQSTKTSADDPPIESTYKWYILTLAALTFTIVVGAPLMSMPVLFDEISRELRLNLVEIGWIWGIGFLTGVVTSLIGGALGDRFGAKRMLTAACFLSGLTGALRGLSNDFTTLALTAFIFGLMPPAIPMSVHKTCGVWFSGRQLGLANGVVATGMGLGFMLGSLLSATVLSPLLGGWRPVLFLYGALSLVVGVFWSFTRAAPTWKASQKPKENITLSHGFRHVARIRNVWLLGLTMFGIGACIQGALGYLPLYLRGIGWPETAADSALATFHGVSMAAAIPIALLSDKLGLRKNVLLIAGLMNCIGVALLSVPGGSLVWTGVVVAGFFRDGFMAILMTLIIELKGVGATYAGTAVGIVLVFVRLGSLISPPIGNALARFNPSAPFLFWASLALMGLFCLYFVKERDKSTKNPNS